MNGLYNRSVPNEEMSMRSFLTAYGVQRAEGDGGHHVRPGRGPGRDTGQLVGEDCGLPVEGRLERLQDLEVEGGRQELAVGAPLVRGADGKTRERDGMSVT